MRLVELLTIVALIGLLVLGFGLSSGLSPWSKDPHVADTDRRHRRRIQVTSTVFGLSWIAVQVGIGRGWLSSTAMILTGAGIVWMLGALAVVSHHQWIRDSDELIRRIETDALAFGLGFGLTALLAIELLATAGIISEISVLRVMLVVGAAYGFGRFLGYQRYS